MAGQESKMINFLVKTGFNVDMACKAILSILVFFHEKCNFSLLSWFIHIDSHIHGHIE